MLKGNPSDLDVNSLLSSSISDGLSTNTAVRIALIGDCSTQFIANILPIQFQNSGIRANVMECGFDSIEVEVLNPKSKLHLFDPQVVVFVNSVQSIRSRFFGGKQEAEEFAEDHVCKVKSLWEILSKKKDCRVIHFNYATPLERIFGNFDAKTGDSFTSLVRSLNMRLSELASQYGNVFIADINQLSAWHGGQKWFDERMWFHAKLLCSLDLLPMVTQTIVDIFVAATARTVKCVVLDLDNTLWGGVIGDDGVEGIKLGDEGVGESFVAFQDFILKLKARGIILAVCSKNSIENAVKPFREHPNMKIKESDIAVFVANWNNKADNIRYIAKVLNIGIDSMVFLDDNPFERNLVREHLPGVVVPELSEDPSDYVKSLFEYNLFETTSFTAEDKQRSEMYREEAQRRELQEAYTNVDDYLKSLNMKAKIFRFDQKNMTRIAQLIQRSNQFNLTTKRYGEADCVRLANEIKDSYPFCVSLEDRFGSYGLISIVVLRFEANKAIIDTLLMSCRVLCRGVEKLVMNHIMSESKSRGCKLVVGDYIPSSKNAMVKDFYRDFAFTLKETKENEATSWEFDVEKFSAFEVFIDVNDDGNVSVRAA